MELKHQKFKMPNETVVNSISISSDGEILAVGQQSEVSDKPAMTFWRFVAEGIEPEDHGLCFEEAFMIHNINFCYHNKYLIFNNILVYDFEEKKFMDTNYSIERVELIKAFDKKPYLLVSGSEIKIMDVKSNKLIWRYPDEIKFSTVSTPVTIANVSEDFGRVIIAGGGSNEVVVMDIRENRLLERLENGPEMAGKVIASNDFKYVFAIGYLGTGLYLWDFSSKRRILTDVIKDHETIAVCFIGSGYLVVGGYSGHIFIIDIEKRNYIFYKSVHDGKITDIKVNYHKKTMVVSSEDGYISLIDIKQLLT